MKICKDLEDRYKDLRRKRDQDFNTFHKWLRSPEGTPRPKDMYNRKDYVDLIKLRELKGLPVYNADIRR